MSVSIGRLYFKPLPWLSLFSLLGLALLLKLGFWQKARLAWKTDLLAQVELATQAPPLTDMADIQALIDQDEFIEFRRVDLRADLPTMPKPYDGDPFYVFTASQRDISWRQFRVAYIGSKAVFIEWGIVTDNMRSKAPLSAESDVPIMGYIRHKAWQDNPSTDSNPTANRWFGFNPMAESDDWATKTGEAVDMSFFIETVPHVSSASELPPKQPDIANNHFDYMLTWFTLAIILIIFYVLIHIREGRAAIRQKS